jgi:hypothetical protein
MSSRGRVLWNLVLDGTWIGITETIQRLEKGLDSRVAFAEGDFSAPSHPGFVRPLRVFAVHAANLIAQPLRRRHWLANSIKDHIDRIEIDERISVAHFGQES